MSNSVEYPLKGITILDFTTALAGPLATLRAADLGATVIKIEGPEHPDITRNMAIGGVRLGEMSTSYMMLNRSKRSLAIELKADEGHAVLRELISRCDAVVTNYRPKAVKSLGLDYASVKAWNHKIVHVAISGFGHIDPEGTLPGIDLLLQAYTGIMTNAGTRAVPHQSSPVFCVDVCTSHLATEALLGGLLGAKITGRGSCWEVSMISAALELQMQEIATYRNFQVGRLLGDEPHASRYMNPPYGLFELADGHLAIARSDVGLVGRTTGSSELLRLAKQRPAETEQEAMREWRDAVFRAVAEVLRTWPVEKAQSTLNAAGIWCSRLQSFDEFLALPGVEDFFLSVENGAHGTFSTLAGMVNFPRISEKSPAVQKASLLGEDTTEILRECGYSLAEIESLNSTGVVFSREMQKREEVRA